MRVCGLKTAVFLVLVLVAGCSEETRLSVAVCGGLEVPKDLDALRISAWEGLEGEVVAGVLELLECPTARLTQLPVLHELGAQSGERRIVVQALKAGVEVARIETRVILTGDDVVTLRLTSDCIGISCPLGQTCLDGTCEVSPFAGDAPMSCAEDDVNEFPVIGSVEDCPGLVP